MSDKDLLPFSWLLFSHANFYEKQIVAYNVKGNKEECEKTLKTENENSRQPMIKVQILSHWRGLVKLFPKAFSPKTPDYGNLLKFCHWL